MLMSGMDWKSVVCVYSLEQEAKYLTEKEAQPYTNPEDVEMSTSERAIVNRKQWCGV